MRGNTFKSGAQNLEQNFLKIWKGLFKNMLFLNPESRPDPAGFEGRDPESREIIRTEKLESPLAIKNKKFCHICAIKFVMGTMSVALQLKGVQIVVYYIVKNILLIMLPGSKIIFFSPCKSNHTRLDVTLNFLFAHLLFRFWF